MESISPICQELKNKYDECFNGWFKDKFLKGETVDSCEEIFTEYQKCVKQAIKEKGIDLPDIDKPILGSDKEKKPPS